MKNEFLCSIVLVFAGVVALAAASPPGSLGNTNAKAITAMTAPAPVDTDWLALLFGLVFRSFNSGDFRRPKFKISDRKLQRNKTVKLFEFSFAVS